MHEGLRLAVILCSCFALYVINVHQSNLIFLDTLEANHNLHILGIHALPSGFVLLESLKGKQSGSDLVCLPRAIQRVPRVADGGTLCSERSLE